MILTAFSYPALETLAAKSVCASFFCASVMSRSGSPLRGNPLGVVQCQRNRSLSSNAYVAFAR